MTKRCAYIPEKKVDCVGGRWSYGSLFLLTQQPSDYKHDATDAIQLHELIEIVIPQVGITVPIILLVLILVSFVVLRKLHCGNCRKSASHHMGRAMGGPQGDSVNIYKCTRVLS